jgi:putative FmdB family regulatory protein
MPIYEYRCAKCDKVSEFLVGVGKEKSEIKCKYCGSEDMTRIISAPFVSSGKETVDLQQGKTCCGRDERCDTPPCSDDGTCVR